MQFPFHSQFTVMRSITYALRLNYRPQRSCGQGYVFTRVCDSVNRGGLRRTPPHPRPGRPPRTRQTPLGPGRPPRDQGEPPPDQAHPPGTRHTPPPDQGEPPPGRTLQHTVNERPVRILLECILVKSNVSLKCTPSLYIHKIIAIGI